jgi:hypothetical protein
MKLAAIVNDLAKRSPAPEGGAGHLHLGFARGAGAPFAFFDF